MTTLLGIHDWIHARLGKTPKTGKKIGRDRGMTGKGRGTRIHAELLRRIRKDPPPERGYHPWTLRLYEYIKRHGFTVDPAPPPMVTDAELGFHTRVDLVLITPEGRRVLVELKTSMHEMRTTKMARMRGPLARWFPHDSVENRAVIQILMPVLAMRELYKQDVYGLVIYIRPNAIQGTIIRNELYSPEIRQALLAS